jgi:TetR/AcrR family fatty acid metabolism transcriptional regulator
MREPVLWAGFANKHAWFASLIGRGAWCPVECCVVDTPQLQPAETNAADSEALPRGGEKYERILDAAIEVIAEKDFHHARVADIASRAGVADGTVYLYFKNKNHILRAAIDAAFAHFSERVSQAMVTAENPLEQLAIIARLHLETLTGRRSLAVIIQREVRQSAKFIAQFSHPALVDYINMVRDTIRRGQEAGLIRHEVSDRMAALCFFGTLDELISSWLFTGKAIDPEQTAAQVIDLLLHGMSTAPSHA